MDQSLAVYRVHRLYILSVQVNVYVLLNILEMHPLRTDQFLAVFQHARFLSSLVHLEPVVVLQDMHQV